MKLQEDTRLLFNILATLVYCVKMAKRGLSRKELEEIKKREEIEAAAEVINICLEMLNFK